MSEIKNGILSGWILYEATACLSAGTGPHSLNYLLCTWMAHFVTVPTSTYERFRNLNQFRLTYNLLSTNIKY